MAMGGDEVKSLRDGGFGYRYISQLGETFYQGMRESLTIYTYYTSIVKPFMILRTYV